MSEEGRTIDKAAQKRLLFVQEYLIDFNATRAAEAAGYSSKAAHTTGHKMLKNGEVQEMIAKAMAERSKRTQVTQDMVVRELAKVGFSDIRQMVQWAGDRVAFVDSDQLPADVAHAVSSVKARKRVHTDAEGGVTETVDMELKVYDKVNALTQLGRHLGMFTDKTEHSGEVRVTEVQIDV
jgi:phage terminase small subunit